MLRRHSHVERTFTFGRCSHVEGTFMCGRDIHMWMGHSHVEVLMCEGDIQMWEVLLCGGSGLTCGRCSNVERHLHMGGALMWRGYSCMAVAHMWRGALTCGRWYV